MITRRTALAGGAALLAGALPAPWSFAQTVCACRTGRVRLGRGRYLGYEEYGPADGPLVFYFHGTPGSRLEAALIASEACSSGIRLVAVDRPGMGKSSYYCGRRILHWPGDITVLADALGYSDAPFGVIGVSGGAPYAAACALKLPDQLTHVAIVSGHTPLDAPCTTPGNQDKIIALVSGRPRLGKLGIRLVARRLDKRPNKVIQLVTKKWADSDRRLILCNPHYYRCFVANLDEATRCGVDGIVTDIRLLACRWGFCLDSISGVPISIWQGGCDRISTPSMAHYFQRHLAGSELMIDSQAGHVTMLKWHANDILGRFV